MFGDFKMPELKVPQIDFELPSLDLDKYGQQVRDDFIYIHIYVCVCVHIYVYIHMYIYL